MRRIAIYFFIFLFGSQLFAQYSGNPNNIQLNMPKIDIEQFTFGIRLSPSISWINIQHDDAIADGATLKFGGGLVAKYEINKLLSLMTGANFIGLGGYMYDSKSLNDPLLKDNYRVNYSAIEIPLGLRVATPMAYKISYYLQGGINVLTVLTANEKRSSAIPNTKIPALDIMPLSVPASMGFYAGIGIERRIFKGLSIFGEINYKNSLSSFANGPEYVSPSNPIYDHGYVNSIDIRPASMEFSFGIMF